MQPFFQVRVEQPRLPAEFDRGQPGLQRDVQVFFARGSLRRGGEALVVETVAFEFFRRPDENVSRWNAFDANAGGSDQRIMLRQPLEKWQPRGPAAGAVQKQHGRPGAGALDAHTDATGNESIPSLRHAGKLTPPARRSARPQ